MDARIKVAGVGGQGVQLIGKLLATSAFRANLNVSQGVKYEPSTSGGLTVADIIITPNEEIDYPFIENDPDIMLILAQRGWDEYNEMIGKNTIVLADDMNVKRLETYRPYKQIRALPFTKTAIEVGSEKVTNVVALGYVAELLDIKGHYFHEELKDMHPQESTDDTLLEVAPEYFESSIVELSPQRYRELNLNAFKRGYDMSASLS